MADHIGIVWGGLEGLRPSNSLFLIIVTVVVHELITEHVMGRRRPTLESVIANLKQPMPFPAKIWKMTRNYMRRVRNLDTCCGHPGEPGC